MNEFNYERREEPKMVIVPAQDFEQVANEICEQALNDARKQLHPLMRNLELRQLHKRDEFIQAFKLALEKRIAQTLAVWQPNVQAVFKFDKSWMDSRDPWDGSVRLLVKVPRLSDTIRMLGKKLDQSLTYSLKKLGWPGFQKRQTILEIQQVTPTELRHGISYGAMFYSVRTVPVKIWTRRSH